MGFYGNTVIETTKSFTDLKIYSTLNEEVEPSILSPGIIRSELFIAPGDPWVGLEAVPSALEDQSDAQLFIFHTSTEQRINNSLTPGIGINQEDRGIIAPTTQEERNHASTLFLNKYCTQYDPANAEVKELALGDTFSALVPGVMKDSEGQDIYGIIVDKAGHIINAKMVTYKLPTTAGLTYDKDKWVTTLYGDPAWYLSTENKQKYKFPDMDTSTGLIQDLYSKITDTTEILSDSGNSGTEEPESYSLKDLLDLVKQINILSKQMNIVYNPSVETNVPQEYNGESIAASDLVKTLLSIRDLKVAADNVGDNMSYIDTHVIQVLQTILACNYNNSSFNLDQDLPILSKMQQLEEIINVMEYFFGLDYQETITDAPDVYVEVQINQDQFDANPSNYYISVNNQMQLANSPFNDSIRYFEHAQKYLIPVQASDAIFEYNYKSFYIKAADGTYRLNTSSNRLTQQTYYLYTKYNISRLLDEFRVTLNGQTSTDLVGYIQKLNSAR